MNHVYQLIARYVCPFTGRVGHPDAEKRSSTLFASVEAAEARVDRFKGIVAASLKVDPDYPIEVTIKEYEVLDV